MYLAALEAIRARLGGQPPEFVAPLHPLIQASVTGPFALGDTTALLSYFQRSTQANVAGLAVPIVPQPLYGTDLTGIYPSLTFRCIGISPRTTEFVPPVDRVYQKVIGSSQPQKDEDGCLLEVSPRMARSKPSGEGVDLLIEVRAYSKDFIIAAVLTTYVNRVLPWRTSLREAQFDGSYKIRAVEQSNFHMQDSEQAAGVLAPDQAAEYLRIWTYKVRSWMDQTDEWALVNLVRYKSTTVTHG